MSRAEEQMKSRRLAHTDVSRIANCVESCRREANAEKRHRGFRIGNPFIFLLFLRSSCRRSKSQDGEEIYRRSFNDKKRRRILFSLKSLAAPGSFTRIHLYLLSCPPPLPPDIISQLVGNNLRLSKTPWIPSSRYPYTLDRISVVRESRKAELEGSRGDRKARTIATGRERKRRFVSPPK